MAVSTGKRKRQNEEHEVEGISEDESAMRARFQRAFEANFTPLQSSKHSMRENDDEQATSELDIEEESDWSGLSEGDEDVVHVVDHENPIQDDQALLRQEKKAFMSSKPPSSIQRPPKALKNEGDPEEDSKEAANLKNDLALQRLLKESHLLEPASFNGKISAPEGKGRIKALDLRLQDLGAKESTSKQHKMPLSHRKGIKTKAADREVRRRKDALENGVVLEKAKTALKSGKRRERSVGGPGLGKFRGGTLKLSSRDVRSIEGPKKTSSMGKKRRR